jgi:hypothetical protein
MRKKRENKKNRREFVKGTFAVAGAAALPPKAFSGSSIKSSVPALEAFVDDRMSSK